MLAAINPARGRVYSTIFQILEAQRYSDMAAQNRGAVSWGPVAKRVYIGYGDEPESAIGAIDPAAGKALREVYPESFQLEKSGPRNFANLPEADHTIAVIDRKTGRISKWQVEAALDFPMALDEGHRRPFLGTRAPPAVGARHRLWLE